MKKVKEHIELLFNHFEIVLYHMIITYSKSNMKFCRYVELSPNMFDNLCQVDNIHFTKRHN